MSSVMSSLIEQYEDLVEAHSDYEETIETDNLEARRVYDEIAHGLQRMSRAVHTAKRSRLPGPDVVEEIEKMADDVSEMLAELAAVL